MENARHGWWYNQLFTNWKKFEVIYVSVLIALQVLVYLIAPDSVIGMVSGVFGTLCLVYGMKGRKIGFSPQYCSSFSLWNSWKFPSCTFPAKRPKPKPPFFCPGMIFIVLITSAKIQSCLLKSPFSESPPAYSFVSVQPATDYYREGKTEYKKHSNRQLRPVKADP